MKRWTASVPAAKRLAAAVALGSAIAALTTGCGYRTVGSTVQLPQNIRTIAIPGFVSQSQTFRV